MVALLPVGEVVAVCVDAGAVDGSGSSCWSSCGVARGADDVYVVEADRFACCSSCPGLWCVVDGEVVGAATVGAEGL